MDLRVELEMGVGVSPARAVELSCKGLDRDCNNNNVHLPSLTYCRVGT